MHKLLLVLCLATTGCASSAVQVESYSGIYSTHFDGIPDDAAICAVVSNQGAERLSWVQLRLHSISHLGAKPATWRSKWVFEGELEPGESIALSFPTPPVSDSVRLEVQRAGRGRPPGAGRRAQRVARCSESDLDDLVADAERTAPNRAVHGMVNWNDGAASAGN